MLQFFRKHWDPAADQALHPFQTKGKYRQGNQKIRAGFEYKAIWVSDFELHLRLKTFLTARRVGVSAGNSQIAACFEQLHVLLYSEAT